MSIAIIVPSLDRPNLLEPLAANIEGTAEGPYSLWFIVDPDDHESRSVLNQIKNASVLVFEGTYPQKINAGVSVSTDPFVALVNDDVVFHPGWHQAVANAFSRPDIHVVGGPDLSPATEDGEHVTMPIVRRSYIENPGGAWQEPGVALHEGYHHNYSETELWQLAADRGHAQFLNDCVIEHCHPDWGKAEMDETYERGARQNFEADSNLFWQRIEAWRQ